MILEKVRHLKPIQIVFLLDHMFWCVHTYDDDDERGNCRIYLDVVDQVANISSGVWEVEHPDVTCQVLEVARYIGYRLWSNAHVIVMMSHKEDNAAI